MPLNSPGGSTLQCVWTTFATLVITFQLIHNSASFIDKLNVTDSVRCGVLQLCYTEFEHLSLLVR